MAAVMFTVSQSVATIGSAVLLADLRENLATRGLVVAQSLSVAGNLLRVAGFAAAGAAFLGHRRHRAGRLRAGLLLVAGGYGAWSLSDVARAVRYDKSHAEKVYIAAHLVLGLSDLLLAVAAASAALAFASVPHVDAAEARGRRDNRLGRGSIVAVAGFLCAMVSSLLFFVTFPSLGATAGFTSGFGISAGGALVGAGGAAIAAVGFLRSGQAHQRRTQHRPTAPDGFLSRAAAVLAVGLVIAAFGGIESASAASINGFDGASSTAAWLDVVRQIGRAAGAGTAAVALLPARSLGARVVAGYHLRGRKAPRRSGVAALLLALVCAAAAVVFLATAGNGRALRQGGSGVPAPEPTVSAELSAGAFRKAADAICRSSNAQAREISSGISDEADSANAFALGAVTAVLREGESKLEALSGPSALEAARDALVKDVDEEISIARRAGSAARDGDQTSFDSALDQVAIETRQAHAAGSSLGAPDCGGSS